jgi:selenocysteine lyase/cysteine desulfurase
MHYIEMTDKDSAEHLRDRFPILNKVIYANHASLSPWPRETMRAVQRYAELTHQSGPLVYAEWARTATRLRQTVADMLNTESAGEISLLQNTTEGINTLADGLAWQPGDNVVALRGDFPSNVLPWKALERQGVEYREVDARTAAQPEQALLERMDNRTRVLAVSSVHWIDGFRLELGRLGRACRPSGVIFMVDAIQQFGALQMNVERDCIDILAAGCQKWQLGPEGMGIFYCRASVRDRLRPSRQGWHMLADRLDFETPGRPIEDSGRRFEAGTPNRLGQVALLASLELMQEYGQPFIEKRILANTGRLMDGLAQMAGIEICSDQEPGRRSGIVHFRSDRLSPDQLVSRLKKRDIIAIQRGNGVRLSPHFYQGAAEMDTLLSGVERALSN